MKKHEIDICGNDETLFSGEVDQEGMGIQLECLAEFDYSKISNYCYDNDLDWRVVSSFQAWNGGWQWKHGRGFVACEEENKHCEKIRVLVQEEIDRLINLYNTEVYSGE